MLLSLILLFGVFYVFFINVIDESWVMVFKLIPMVLIIILAFTSKNKVPRYQLFVCIGLIICAIGDYTIQWFIIGLSSFLIGHIFYIVAFLGTKEQQVPSAAKGILLVVGVVMTGIISGTLMGRGELVLAIAVLAYITVILTMGWTSFRTGSRFAIIGALLFLTSDTILAINKFIVDVPYSHQLIMSTYYGAQILIALSIAQYSAIRNKMIQ